MSFDTLGLAPELLRAVADQGYTVPTPVQAEAIPLVLAGRDLLAGAQTGTGKTAAFVLPMLQRLGHADIDRAPAAARSVPSSSPRPASSRSRSRRASASTDATGASARPPSTAASASRRRSSALRRGPESSSPRPAACSTTSASAPSTSRTVEILVLDEADRMLDMGFIRDIRQILASCRPRRQNLLFCATFSDEIRALAGGFLHDPASVQVAPRNSAAPLVRQVVHPVDRERKRELLSHLVRTGAIDQALVFTRTKHGANRLAEQLARDGIAAVAIHGNKSQGQRVRALDDFKTGRSPILVATEIAARGLDIDGLPHVVNFELPMVARGLRPPHRPDRPSRLAGPRRLARLRRRAQAAARHRAPARAPDPARSSPASSPIARSVPSRSCVAGSDADARSSLAARDRCTSTRSARHTPVGSDPGPRPGDDRGGVAPARQPSGAPRYDAGPRADGHAPGPGRPDAPTRPVGQPWVAGAPRHDWATARRTGRPGGRPKVGRVPARDVPEARHTPVSRSAIAPPVDPATDRPTTASGTVHATVAVLPADPRRCPANASPAPRTDRPTAPRYRGAGPGHGRRGPHPRVTGRRPVSLTALRATLGYRPPRDAATAPSPPPTAGAVSPGTVTPARSADRGALSARPDHRAWRDGHGPQGARRPARSRRRGQAPTPGGHRDPRPRPAVPPRGACGDRPAPPEHRRLPRYRARTGDQPFLVMDLVDGEDLAARLHRGGRLAPAQAARIGLDVARALGVAHVRGIVHRDIKPANVLLAGDGRAMVTDFGIARLAMDAEASMPGTTLGSVHYFSPEQARGATTTPASDVYGLGLVLYESLTGARAWTGDTTDAIALARVGAPAPSVRARCDRRCPSARRDRAPCARPGTRRSLSQRRVDGRGARTDRGGRRIRPARRRVVRSPARSRPPRRARPLAPRPTRHAGTPDAAAAPRHPRPAGRRAGSRRRSWSPGRILGRRGRRSGPAPADVEPRGHGIHRRAGRGGRRWSGPGRRVTAGRWRDPGRARSTRTRAPRPTRPRNHRRPPRRTRRSNPRHRRRPSIDRGPDRRPRRRRRRPVRGRSSTSPAASGPVATRRPASPRRSRVEHRRRLVDRPATRRILVALVRAEGVLTFAERRDRGLSGRDHRGAGRRARDVIEAFIATDGVGSTRPARVRIDRPARPVGGPDAHRLGAHPPVRDRDQQLLPRTGPHHAPRRPRRRWWAGPAHRDRAGGGPHLDDLLATADDVAASLDTRH